jgi:hypothetical protein
VESNISPLNHITVPCIVAVFLGFDAIAAGTGGTSSLEHFESIRTGTLATFRRKNAQILYGRVLLGFLEQRSGVCGDDSGIASPSIERIHKFLPKCWLQFEHILQSTLELRTVADALLALLSPAHQRGHEIAMPPWAGDRSLEVHSRTRFGEDDVGSDILWDWMNSAASGLLA